MLVKLLFLLSDQLGDKTFFYRDGIWVDAEYAEDMKIVKLELFSKKYFDVLRRKPGLGKYFSIAKNIMVVFESVCYQISE